jgi:hypothetical protein
MTQPPVSHLVILRDALPSAEVDLFRRLSLHQDTESDGSLICLECSAVDVSHHNYIELQVHRREDEPPLSMRLPHYLILMILDESELPPRIGFVPHS